MCRGSQGGQTNSCNPIFIHSFIHFRYLYSAPSIFLLRGAPDYSADTESEFHAEAHEQLRVKDLPRVPTWQLEVDSNPQPSGCKAPNIPLHHCAPQWVTVPGILGHLINDICACQTHTLRITRRAL